MQKNNSNKNIYDNDIDDLVNEKLNKMSEEDLQITGKKYKKKINTLFSLTFSTGMILLLTSMFLIILFKLNTLSILSLIGTILISLLFIFFAFKNFSPQKVNRKSDVELVKLKLREDIKDEVLKQRAKNKLPNQFMKKPIKYVQVLDTYTEWSDKLHPILNWQEVIQTRYCKFKIVYEDDSDEIADVKTDSDEYNFLIKYVKQSENIENQHSVADEIRKYKQLLDEGIISEDEFNKKKDELLK